MAKEDIEKQYDLGLKEPWTNRFWKVRTKFSNRLRKYEKYRFLKQSFIWLFVVLIVLLNVLIYDYYLGIESSLPDALPLLNNYIQLAPRLISIDELILIPVLSSVVSLILVLTSIRLYNRKPYYSFLVLMVLSVALTGILINLVDLASQYL